jgi:polyphosphate kinase
MAENTSSRSAGAKIQALDSEPKTADVTRLRDSMGNRKLQPKTASEKSQPEPQNLKQPELYLNRHISLLEFNRRVLAYAKDESVPLLERLKYLCIASSNLDEFFEIRVAVLKQRLETGSVETGPDKLSPSEVLKEVGSGSHVLVKEQYEVLNDLLIPALRKQRICFLKRDEWNAAQEEWVRTFFVEQLSPMLSPIGLDPAHPFPRILNKGLNFIVSLKGKDAFGRDSGMAVVNTPRALPRILQLPEGVATKGHQDFVFLSSIVHAYVDELFPGMKTTGCYQFRVTRNSDLFVDEEEIEDLARALEGELSARRYGAAVRLEVADNCPNKLTQHLQRQFELGDQDVYRVNGPVNLNRLAAIYDEVDRSDLKFPGFRSGLPPHLAGNKDLFDEIRKGDILLHHPYESFVPVIDLLRQASTDSMVLAIKQTLYRTGPESAVVNALVEAAGNGKEVTVVIELRARFDEAENIELASRLQQAGAHVVYGIVGYKTHCKMLMILRREGKKLRRYVHLGTGNYHPRTVRLYSDYGLMTSDKSIGEDVHNLFMQLTSLGKVTKLNSLLQSPFTLHPKLLELIAEHAEKAEQGKQCRIIIKINSLTEPQLIQALYAAAQSGVRIDLIVRGMCVLKPGIEGVSDNIRVRSIVGRFLEHTRVFYFQADKKDVMYCSSADWMERNMFRRVEVAFPINDDSLRARILNELITCLQDNTQAWLLAADGIYHRAKPGDDAPITAQLTLLEQLAN